MRRPGSSRQRPRPAPKTNEPAFEAAVRYLGPRPRSVREVRQHLRKKRYDDTAIDQAVARLRELGYLDDAAFARYWLEQRARFRPKGPFALKAELRAKGVESDAIDAALAEAEGDEAQAARAALEPRLARWRALGADERRAKAQAFLRQRGFSFDAIEEVLRGIPEGA